MLKTNEGSTDRILRIVLGIILSGLAFLKLSGTMQVIALIVGVIALGTGLTGFCALYKLLGISTIKNKKS